MKQRGHKSGLSLLETLVALAIMALLATALSSGLGFGILGLKIGARIDAKVEQALARHKLRIWIEHVLPTPNPMNERLLLSGAQDSLTFLADLEGTDPRIDRETMVIVSYDRASGQFRAVGTPGDPEISLKPVADGVDPQILLLGQTVGGSGAALAEDWPESLGLPELVRITFLASDVPPMVVRPGRVFLQSEMSLSSLLPPALPSRP